MKESYEKQISFPEINSSGMEIVLEYIYTGLIKEESYAIEFKFFLIFSTVIYELFQQLTVQQPRHNHDIRVFWKRVFTWFNCN